MNRDRFRMPVRGVSPDELPAKMRESIEVLQRVWPAETCLTIFVSDFGEGGGLAYISNGERASMIETVKEWLEHQANLS